MVLYLHGRRRAWDMDVKEYRMFQDGLGEQAEFFSYHPLVNLSCFGFIIGVAMFSTHPLFLALILLAGSMYSALLKGKRAWRTNVGMLLFMLAFMTLVNGLVTHNGVTVLFYLNQNRVTLEALLFGMASAALLAGVIIWFGCFQIIMSSDKFIYLFGRVVPILAMTLSMVFRFLPLFKARFTEIHNGQKCMGRNISGGSRIGRIRAFFKEVSILIAWSLEASIETSDSMEARGYGLRGRTSFHLYRFSRRDAVALAVIGLLGALSVTGCAMGKTAIYYYPGIWVKAPDVWFFITLVSYLALLVLPMAIDIEGERKWRQLYFET